MTFADAVPGPEGPPLDQIRLTGVSATGHHGVLPSERENGQIFRADVVLHLDTRAAAGSDDLAATVSYAEVAEDVHGVLAGPPVDLVETVAERIAAVVLTHAAVHTVDVRVHKPQAPIEVPFDDVEVVVRRDRERMPAVPADDATAAAVHSRPLPVRTPAEPMPPVPAPVPPAPEAAEVPEAPEVPEDVPAPDPLDAAPDAPVDAVLALGANLGDPQATLRAAVTDIDRIPGLQVTEVSPLARTAAVGPEQPDFLNAVLLVRTSLSPRDLLGVCQEVELLHGREREERWGPRTLDIDVVQYGTLTVSTDDLELPHPRAHERAFVLVPWVEVDPHAVLAGLGGGPVAQLAATAPDRPGIRWLALDWLADPPATGAVPAQPDAVDPAAAGPDGPVGLPAPDPYAGEQVQEQQPAREQMPPSIPVPRQDQPQAPEQAYSEQPYPEQAPPEQLLPEPAPVTPHHGQPWDVAPAWSAEPDPLLGRQEPPAYIPSAPEPELPRRGDPLTGLTPTPAPAPAPHPPEPHAPIPPAPDGDPGPR